MKKTPSERKRAIHLIEAAMESFTAPEEAMIQMHLQHALDMARERTSPACNDPD